eukprot:scpid70576/ scgid6250/ Probable RNA-directed DNA polymerase from transposon X-element; Reverse transcriptase
MSELLDSSDGNSSSYETACSVAVKKSPRSDPKNYRPVSLLSILSKVMESIVNKQLVNYLERFNILPDSQYGFRQGRGTCDILTALHTEWVKTVSDGGYAHMVAVDIAGAFDRVSHSGLIFKAKNVGIGGCLLHWLQDYLLNRKLSVLVHGDSSSPAPITAGVPQGSILGPTLFLLYVSDLDQCLSPETRLSSFADDTTLYSLIRMQDNMHDMTAALQSSLKRLEEWGERWRIRFEPSKSQQLLMTTKATHPAVPDIKFGGIAVPEANTIKLLGVTFDAKLSFRDHLHSIATRGCQRLGVLRRACRVLDYHGRLCAYKGFVRPILEYAPLVWMGAASSHLARLDRVQKRAMAIIGPGALLQSLCHRRIVSGLVYLYKLQCIPGPPQLTAMIPPPANHVEARRTRSQPPPGQQHHVQLQQVLDRRAPAYASRSFPFSVVSVWNSLPSEIVRAPLSLKRLHTFKEDVHKYLTHQHWLMATDFYG